MRKVILNLAISLDGYIADNNGGFDWIVGHGDTSLNTSYQFSFDDFLVNIDTIIMGSKAYEDCILTGLSDFGDKEIIVSTNRDLERRANVKFVSGDTCKILSDLKKEKGKDIYLFGGAGSVAPFIEFDLIDTYIIGIIPVLIGQGRRLFNENNKTTQLKLIRSSISDGITILEYIRR